VSRPVILVAAAAGCVLAGGALIAVTWHLSYGHGLYCALGTATTVGCDAEPRSGTGMLAAAAVMLTAIPLLAAAFGQLHLDKVREHVDRRLGEHREPVHAQSGPTGNSSSGKEGTS
jgi:ion channel